MKIMKKVMSLAIVGTMVLTMIVGCGNGSKQGGKNSKGDKVIEVRAWQSGMGIAWLENMIEGFEKKYPEYEVRYVATADSSGTMPSFGNPDADDTDLYFSLPINSSDLVSLDEILDTKVDGESKTIREKFDSSYLNAVTNPADGKVYALTYGGGIMGIAYNKKLFEKAGITDLPRTTDELVNLCDMLKRNEIIPWTHFQGGGYWCMLTEALYMQYEGADYYSNVFYANTDEKGNSPSLDVFTRKDGRYEVLKFYEKILLPEYVLSGSNSGDHITMQTRFVNGQAAMMVNGAWMSNEMASVGSTEDFGMMKTPVISSIVNKLTTVKKDSQLRAVVEAVDAVTDGEKSIDDYRSGKDYMVDELKVSAADWDYIMAARNTNASNFSGMGTFIPTYADQKEGAVEFLRYFYSDEGYKIFLDTTNVALPLSLDSGNINTDTWSGFAKDTVSLMNTTKQYSLGTYSMSISNIFTSGAVDLFAGRPYVQYLSALNEQDRKNADTLWNEMIDYINSNYESQWLKNLK